MHVALGHLGQGVGICYLQVPDNKIVEAGELVLYLGPPDTGAALLVGIDDDRIGPTAGLAHPLVIRLSQFYPEFYLVAEALPPDVRFFVGADSPGKAERTGCVEGKGDNSQ